MPVRDVSRALTITFFACVVLAGSAWPFPRVNAVLRILGGAFSVLAGIALVLE